MYTSIVMESDEYIRPPGTYYDIVAHPSDARRAIEVAVVQDHRFAFFYWLKWGRRQNGLLAPPALVSLDWHQDLAAPDETECEWLRDLDTSDYREVSFFCWDKLHCLNDGHILSAAYLNIIGDIHVVQKQRDEYLDHFEDVEGRMHAVRCYESTEALIQGVSAQDYPSVFFDIDLDYFTESPDPHGGGENLTLVARGDIEHCLCSDGEFMTWIFSRIAGMTIATEPEFCGGLMNSNYLFDVVCNTLFSPPLLSHRAGWRHHAESVR